MKEFMEAAGAGLLIPSVLFAVALYMVRGLFSLYDQKNKIRREFLELWDAARSSDDLWLEIAVRQWMGTYLPAHVIRLALEQPDKSQSLAELSELWPYLRYNRTSRTVEWSSLWLLRAERTYIGRHVWDLAYFAMILVAMLLAAAAYRVGNGSGWAWIYSIGFAIFLFGAFASLMRKDTSRMISTNGEEWIRWINDSVAPAGTHSRDDAQGTAAAPH